MGKRKTIDRHHIRPTSRFSLGEDVDRDNVVWWDTRFHQKMHSLFSNLTLDEIIQLLTEMSTPDECWDNKRIFRRINEIRKQGDST